MSYIYALKLTNDKYYVGKTHQPDMRLEQHEVGDGAAWTRKYKPIEVLFVKLATSVFDEDNQVKVLMAQYGVHNVRGGSYCTEQLDQPTIQLLLKELRSANDLCLYCGGKDHFVAACPKKDKPKTKKGKCTRCGRNTHTKETCHALTKLNGKPIKKIQCSVCHQQGHQKNHCPNQVIIK